MKRINAKQKDFDNLKRQIEKKLVLAGGEFIDIQSKNAVLSVYKLNDKTQTYRWHSSYSDVRAIQLVGADIKRILNELGVRGSKRALCLTYFSPMTVSY